MTPPPASPEPANSAQPPSPAERPAPFYRRSFFWVLIGMLAGLSLAGALYFLYGGRLAAAPPEAETGAEAETVSPDDLLEMQRARNKGLEEEIQRLRAALTEDPCSLPGIIGVSPDKAPVAPGYNPPAADADPRNPPQSPPGGSGPFAPSAGNATSPATPAPNAGNATVPATPAPAPHTVGELMDQATVFVVSALDEQVGMGTGFFVAPGVIATNRHVAQGRTATIYVGNKALGGMHKARLIALSNDESRDYALLGISPALASRAPVLRIADTVSRMDRVSAWGFPGYITEIDPKLTALARGDEKSVPEVVYSSGEINVILERTPPVILHSAAISQGNSGGPLVNAQGVVVGINTFIKVADKSHAQANIALPGKDLALFMKENGVPASMAAQ